MRDRLGLRLLGAVGCVIAMAAPAAASKTEVASTPPPAGAPLDKPVERRLHSNDITASSFMWNDWNKFVENYNPSYVGDDDATTTWMEGAKGSGAGEWLRIQITPLDSTTSIRLHLRNGYQKTKDTYRANARARQVTLRLLPSKVEKQVTLADREGWQDVVIEQPSAEVRTVELVIDSVYEGTKYDNLCLSDVQVFATSITPDNPAFEKSKHKALMDWRAQRMTAAAKYRSQKTELPLYPAYEVDTTETDAFSSQPDAMIKAAQEDPKFTKEWQASLAVAAEVAGHLDDLSRVELVPVSQAALVAVDGLELVTLDNTVGHGMDGLSDSFVFGESLHLPMLGSVSSLFAERLRVLGVKDTLTISQFLHRESKCTSDLSWVKHGAPSDKAPAPVQALVFGSCKDMDERNGPVGERRIEIYVYDGQGRMVLNIGDGRLDAYRWVEDHGRPMLAGGRSALSTGVKSSGKLIEVKKRAPIEAKKPNAAK